MNSNLGGFQTGPYGAPYQVPGPPPPVAKGLAIGALVAGIVAFLLGWVPVVGLLLGAGAVMLGALALKRSQPKPLAITGIVLGGLAGLTSLLLTAGLVLAPSEFSDGFAEGMASVTATPSATPTATGSETPRESPSPTLEEAAPKLALVPNVVGMPVSEAKVALQEAGLTVSDGGADDGHVVTATDPAGGTEVEVGSAIALVAEAPMVNVPNVVGMAVSEAENALSDAGFAINAGGSSDDNIVSQQTPAGGEQAIAGATVTVTAVPRPVDKAQYVTLNDREFGLIGKDPDAHVGKKVVLYSDIFQFDSFTGKCAFMANSSNAIQEYSFDYTQNTAGFAGDGETDCPILDDIIEGDVVKVWATVSGSYDYETQIGGSTTALLVQVDAIEYISSGS